MLTSLDAALNYLAKGYSVIPLHPREKKAAIAWDKFKTDRPTEREVAAWFKGNMRNVGIVTGAVSGIVVLDVDAADKEGEPDGAVSLAKMVEHFGPLPETAVSSTGSGKHIVFKHPGFELRNFSKKKRTGLDFRGDGGYIVAAPSVHPNGSVYQWVTDAAPADMPAWLAELASDGPEPDWFTTMFPPPKKPANERAERKARLEGGNGAADIILNNCAFCQHARDCAETLAEPEWYAMLTNIGRADGGRELVHELSKPYRGYSERETDKKLDHALERGEPHTCQYIQDNLGFTGCPDGGCGVKAPIGFATDSLLMAKVAVDSAIRQLRVKVDRDTVFDGEVIGALATLKQRDAAEYAKRKGELKDVCGSTLSIRDLESAVKQRQAEMQRLRIVGPDDKPQVIEADWLAKKPFDFEMRKPGDWTINESGISKVIFDDSGATEIKVCSAPVFITRRLKQVDDGGDTRIELSWWRDNDWQHTIVDADVAFTSSKVTVLRKHDVPISSETARFFVSYLQDFERTNGDAIPLVQTVSRMGWYGSKHFFPGIDGEYIVDNPEMAKQISGFHESGELAEWVQFIQPVRQYPIARMMLACSFAAPLMRLVNQRIFIFHAYGRSRGGKTAAMVAALSVWGQPEAIMANFNTTKVGLEQLAGFYNDLPLGIDEQQIAARNQGFIESLVYMLSMGKGKTRGAKSGGIREYQQWKTIVLTTGEDPISSDSSTAGVKSRALEVYGAPIPDELVAQRIHRGIGANYGAAGVTFIRRIFEELEENPKMITDDHEKFLAMMQKLYGENLSSHVSSVATAMMADFYASQWIFGQDEATAFQEATSMGAAILKQLEKTSDADDALRAYDYITSWADANSAAFTSTVQSIWFGFTTKDYLYVFPTVFDKAMKDGGFNSRRILKDWAMLGTIEITKGGGTERHTVREYVNMTGGERPKREQKRFICIKRALQAAGVQEEMELVEV